ncbi:conserved unknown protein [Ectocarpus siliculosus]|uniref:RING-type domain-containing protein n=1 Tax=Ectocarpus siliculosus TaxID=2880 RepID=D8LGR9_ECTSI|nr:conserved unknown protein [Ectocarpus siliculosus]|eukprot:CBN79089.1 conserved unknown protein [Ectocarpus siliculosus]
MLSTHRRLPAATIAQVEAEGKLYSVPDGVKMVRPSSKRKKGKWWKRISRKTKDASIDEGGSNDMAKPPACFEEAMARGAADGNDVAPGSQSGDGDISGEGEAAGKDLRSAGERACQICFDQDYSTVMLPCGHGGLCWECGLHIYTLTEECPMCRTKIELLVPLDNENKRFEGGCEFVSSSAAFGKDGKTSARRRHQRHENIPHKYQHHAGKASSVQIGHIPGDQRGDPEAHSTP